MKIRLKYLSEDVDRYGNVRCYVRQPGRPKVRVRSMPGTEDFMREYHAALADSEASPRQTRSLARGSFRHLCIAYYGSSAFTRLDLSTQSWQRRALDRICEQNGEKPIAMMQQKHVRKLRDELKDTPGAAKHRLKALRALFRWGGRGRGSAARSNDRRQDDQLRHKGISLLDYR